MPLCLERANYVVVRPSCHSSCPVCSCWVVRCTLLATPHAHCVSEGAAFVVVHPSCHPTHAHCIITFTYFKVQSINTPIIVRRCQAALQLHSSSRTVCNNGRSHHRHGANMQHTRTPRVSLTHLRRRICRYCCRRTQTSRP